MFFSPLQESSSRRSRRSEDPFAILARGNDQPEFEQSNEKLIDRFPGQFHLLFQVALRYCPRPHYDPHQPVGLGRSIWRHAFLMYKPIGESEHEVSMRLAGTLRLCK